MNITYTQNSHRTFKALTFQWLFLLVFISPTACSTTSKVNEESISGPGPYVEEEGEKLPPSVVSTEEYSDPLEFINRPIFLFNDVLYRYLLSPISEGYEYIMPTPVSQSVTNFFSNLREPLYSINHLLQGKPTQSGKNLLRLVINSTIGLLGLFDPAEAWMDLKKEKSTLSDTIAFYGLDYGFYLVIPILGPSDIRDVVSMTSEYLTHPLNYIEDSRTARYLFIYEGFHEEVPRLSRYPDILKDIDDPYIYVRNLYIQGIERDAKDLRGEAFKKADEKVKE